VGRRERVVAAGAAAGRRARRANCIALGRYVQS
jgi:hypothetical protein